METISKSKQKRLDQKKWNEDKKKKDRREKIKVYAVAGIVIAGLIAGTGASVYRRMTYVPETDTASDNFSEILKSNGFIAGLTTSRYIDDFDPSVIEVQEEDITYSDEDLENDINNLLASKRTLHDDSDLTVKDGDTISLDYVGKVDGKEFIGGSTDGQGADLVIGSGTFIDGFEEQLIGSHPGDDVTVNVTFPEEYGSENLAGKDAEFAVHINGIYETYEFNDEFVAKFYPEYASAESYKEHMREEAADTLVENAIHGWLMENYWLPMLPSKYCHHIKELTETMNMQQYAQEMQMYQMYGMEMPYTDYKEYIEAQEGGIYDEILTEQAEHLTAVNILYQKICEDNGIRISSEDFEEYIEENEITDEIIDYYGKPYIKQMMLREKALEFLKDKVTIIEAPVEEVTEETSETATEESADSSEEQSSEPETAQEEISESEEISEDAEDAETAEKSDPAEASDVEESDAVDASEDDDSSEKADEITKD